MSPHPGELGEWAQGRKAPPVHCALRGIQLIRFGLCVTLVSAAFSWVSTAHNKVQESCFSLRHYRVNSWDNECEMERRDRKEPVKSHLGKVDWGIKPNVLNPSDFLITQNKHSLISPSGPEYLVLKRA